MALNHFIKYPFVNEVGEGCKAIVQKVGLYVQCNRTCKSEKDYCKTCSFSFNIIHLNNRVVGGFKGDKPKLFDKMPCFRQTLKKHGLNITKIKKEAEKFNLTLNMDFVNEVKEKQSTKRRKKERIDVSVVNDTSDEEEEKRGRGRPKKLNNKDESDLINDLIENEPDESLSSDDDSDEEIVATAIPFDYTGSQEEYRDKSLYIDDCNRIYDNQCLLIGTFNKRRNEIINPFP